MYSRVNPYTKNPGRLDSLEAKHLTLVWIMKVMGPKNQADFIEVLYTENVWLRYTMVNVQTVGQG